MIAVVVAWALGQTAAVQPAKVIWQSLDTPPAKAGCHAVSFHDPHALAVDGNGNLLIVNEKGDYALQQITAGGEIRTLLNRSSPALRDGKYFALSLAVDVDNSVVLGIGQRKTIERLRPDGSLVRIAGIPGKAQSVDGPAQSATFKAPRAVALDGHGTIYVADSRVIRRIDPSGAVTTLAGNEHSKEDYADGTGRAAAFNAPVGMAVGSGGVLLIAEGEEREGERGRRSPFGAIRKLDRESMVTTFAGAIHADGFMLDGLGQRAMFTEIRGMAQDTRGNLYVTQADTLASAIRRIDPDGRVQALIYSDPGSRDGAAAQFQYLTGIGIDTEGNLYVVDTDANTLLKVDPKLFVTTLCECN
jgi:sugar lactone lactonase YvrE